MRYFQVFGSSFLFFALLFIALAGIFVGGYGRWWFKG